MQLCWLLRVKWHRTYKMHTTDIHSGQRNKNCMPPASLRFIYIHPLWAEFQTVWLSLLSIAYLHKCYRTAKGSEIPAYCRVCPEPFFPPYHRKGMFSRLRRTIKLKAVSSLLGRTPRLQARSAWAESPVCRYISTFPIVAVLTLHPTISSY